MVTSVIAMATDNSS